MFIVDKYYRVPTGDVHDIKGYGIGLAYVRAVIEQHHGKIELKSSEGKGCNFKISLPINYSSLRSAGWRRSNPPTYGQI